MREFSARQITTDDFNLLHKEYLKGSFDLPAMGKLQFLCEMSNIVESNHEVLMIYEKSTPIAFVASNYDGWRYEPHVEFFKHTSKRNILESACWFFQYLKSRGFGVIVVRALEDSKNYFDHVCRHGQLDFVGKITKGDRRGDEYIYSTTGDVK